jgi:Ran GTPase-activating protein (RanGAP) involved in mRNA processing and transport
MKNIKDLTVKVTYVVGLGDLEMPIEVYDQLMEADENGDDIDTMSGNRKYEEAAEWLSQNIRERDCMEWKAEVIELCEAE